MTKEGVWSFKGEMVVEGRVNNGGRHLLNLRTCCKRLDTAVTYNEACVAIGEADLKVKMR